MILADFKRVSIKRPCWICGKSTYCGFSRMKVPGSSRCSSQWWKYTRSSRNSIRHDLTKNYDPDRQLILAAPLQIREAVFQELIRILPLLITWRKFVTDLGGLLRAHFPNTLKPCGSRRVHQGTSLVQPSSHPRVQSCFPVCLASSYMSSSSL